LAAPPSASPPAAAGAAPAAPPGRLAAFSALGHRNFRFFFLGHLSVVAAQSMEFVAMAWLVLDLTHSPAILGLTSLAQALPTLAFFLVAGTVADRMDRRRLLTFLAGAAGVVYLVIGMLVLTHAVQVWQVILAAFLLGCLRVMDQPARHGMIPNTVPREDLPSAVAMASLAFQIPRPVAPALAGLLIAAVGIGATNLIVGAGSLAAMVFYGLMRVDAVPRRGEKHGWIADIAEGLRYVRGDQVIYGLIGMTFVNSLFGMSYVVLLPVLAREVLDVGPAGYGFMQTAAGVGGLFGALAAAQLARSGNRGRQALAGAVVFGVLLLLLAFCPWYLPVVALLFCIGMANQLYMTTTTTTLQLSIPNELRGRVMSIWGLTFSLIPTGGAISGAIAEQHGVQAALALGGVAVIGTTLAVAALLPHIRKLDQAVAPATAG
jgi:MFS family permease